MSHKQIDYTQHFIMVAPCIRKIIITTIDTTPNNSLELNITNRETTNYWKTKHHPTKDIPTKIYLLGNGTRDELYDKYKIIHGYLDYNEFTNYLRELIKQKIAITQ